MTGAEMCEHLGLLGNQATKIERGDVALSAHDALKLCILFNVDLATLLDGVPFKRKRG